MHESPQLSILHHKRQSFHKEIRSKFKSDYFATQRKLLFQSQLNQVSFLSPEQTRIITSVEQLQDHLNTVFVPNYQAVNIYLKQHQNVQLPQKLQYSLIQQSLKPQFLKNQNALVALVTLWNMKSFDHSLLTEQRIHSWVKGIIEQNLVLQDPHHLIYRVNYFTTVCWVLFALAHIVKDKQYFLPLKQHLNILQCQGNNLQYEFIALLSQLSTLPQLLPSEQFIISVLHKSNNHSHNKSLMIFVVNLLDNYIRYNAQQLHRFQKEQHAILAIDYMVFIANRLKQVFFPNQLKVQLIKLMISLIRSSSNEVLHQIFENKESLNLCIQLFYRAEFDQQEGKVASLMCFIEILSLSQLTSKVTEFIGAEAITHLCVNSLSLPNKRVQLGMLSYIHYLLSQMPVPYKNQFRKYNFVKKVRDQQVSDQRDLGQSSQRDEEQQYTLEQYAQSIYQEHYEVQKK